MDELQRKMHSEAMDFAFRCSVVIVAAEVYAQAVGLPVPPLYWVLIAMMACWSVGVVVAFRRYR